MKKRVLCFGDSNTWGARPMASPDDLGRFGEEVRWPMVAAAELGTGYTVIEEGLNGRTTCHDDPIEGRYKNGERFLDGLLESHAPLDLVVIKLGTNDLKARFSLTATDIANGAGRLAGIVQTSAFYGSTPAVLLIAPAPIVEVGWLGDMFAGGAEKSRHFSHAYREVANRLKVSFLDAGSIVSSSPVDGIHLEAGEQVRLGRAVGEQVRAILS